jgi:ribosomal protein S18 acetylase RimI-like enzyme
MAHAEEALIEKGCVKINLQIFEGNESVVTFYSKLGYAVEKRINMGKRIPKNAPRI